MAKIIPIKKSKSVDFLHSLNDELSTDCAKRTTEEILMWGKDTAKFIYKLQIPQLRKRRKKLAENFKW